MNRRAIFLTARQVLTFILLSYAFVLSPFVDASQRNYLVLFAGVLGAAAIVAFKVRLTQKFFLGLTLLSFMVISALRVDPAGQLLSVALTAVYAAGYFAVIGLLERVQKKREYLQDILFKIIVAFAIVSVLQMVTSLIGLPIPNKIASKGLWSYNSLSMEPSHLGRVVGITMLAYLYLARPSGRPRSLWYFLRRERTAVVAFLVTMLLSGSSLAVLAILVTLLLYRSLLWGSVIVLIASFAWPMAQSISYEPLQRVVALIDNFDTQDLSTFAQVDTSGASRVLPTIIYLQDASPSASEFWIGYGGSGPEMFFSGKIPGQAETTSAGLIPGFFIVYGALLAVFFLWTFVFRYGNQSTAPVIIFWLIFMSTSPYNTQVLWYGLIIIQAVAVVRKETATMRMTGEV